MKKLILIVVYSLHFTALFAQERDPGILSGTVLDRDKRAVEAATVLLQSTSDSLTRYSTMSARDGSFNFSQIAFGYYRLKISSAGLQSLILDSIYFRAGRFDFNLNDLVLLPRSNEELATVTVYSEKPLIESKDGNITFNAAESALAAGSNASELLENVPLVAKNSDGKITVRGKEPRILIDDKPVELNLQQLQDLLESLPGSSIEKIEVMTNPPPQYANEPGGVINIVTKKGKVGRSGRASISAGSRGEGSINGNFNYRRQGFAVSINGGLGYSRLLGNGNSSRNNVYTDSSNFFNTGNHFINKNWRPNFRMNMDYDLSKTDQLNLVLNYNQNDYDNLNSTEYRNINRFGELWKLSRRDVHNRGDNYNPSMNISYTRKSRPGETLKIISGFNFSGNNSDRDFFQEYFNPDHSATGQDSTQEQRTATRINGHNLRVNYDRMLANKKTFLSLGTYYTRSNNHITVDASYLKKPEGTMLPLDLLTNDFWFHQTVTNLRASAKQLFSESLSVMGGASFERTDIFFELLKDARMVRNHYGTLLPFANFNKTWKDRLSLTVSYKRSIRRPGIGELNPSIDYSDPYNIRFGNEKLEASTADNFDLVLGRTRPKYFVNLGLGYNIVQDVFSQVRTLLPEGKTQVTWENISGRKEYEASSWNGVTLSRKIKISLTASFIYSRYSAFDKLVRKYRDGGSLTSNFNYTYTPTDLWNVTGSFNLNRFANPQGYNRWTTSMKLGFQKKFLAKKLSVSLNVIDPFGQQQTRNFTFGSNFNLESFSSTHTRNYRLTVAYNFNKTAKKSVIKKGN